ncbi:RHS repeat-associated core domain-containing protein [Pseudomonas sp. Sample_16]|uniref:RHS repeat-associated core domain-containing protein n=1 Tax=Pseudomonas sp. Sample_16 TaxID=2448263 RepID=UPI001032D8E3|nr:RHS repeat-associated core domain-containing protein [Pseudomonas sp. Sample_16]
MSTRQPALYVQYRYDPLDRLTSHSQSNEPARQRFYCKSRLATEIQGELHRSIVQYDDQLLAQQARQGDDRDTTLLNTDLQRSVLHRLKASQPLHPNVYTAYGHRAQNGLPCLLGFNGERPEPVTGHYLLGNGYRAFNPVLMRFNSPDSLSPFGKGGINPYAYCLGDPINRYDQDGHISILFKAMQAWMNRPIAKTVAGVKKSVVVKQASLSGIVNSEAMFTLSKYLGQNDMDNLAQVARNFNEPVKETSVRNLRIHIESRRVQKQYISNRPDHGSFIENPADLNGPPLGYSKALKGVGSAGYKALDPTVHGSDSLRHFMDNSRKNVHTFMVDYNRDEVINRHADFLAGRLMNIRKGAEEKNLFTRFWRWLN